MTNSEKGLIEIINKAIDLCKKNPNDPVMNECNELIKQLNIITDHISKRQLYPIMITDLKTRAQKKLMAFMEVDDINKLSYTPIANGEKYLK